MILSNFHSLRPPQEASQEESLEWLVEAHTQAEKGRGVDGEALATFREQLRTKLWHVGCKPDRISQRGSVIDDFLHRDWEKMQIYALLEKPEGRGLAKRMELFGNYVETLFETYYPEGSLAPDELIHVTCTGYLSPSGAQKIVSKRGWGEKTQVTHAYHMGCYGSIPALRMVRGMTSQDKGVDIVHTEICSLHSNPALHATDQLVSQSLFADGFMKYSARQEGSSGLKVLALREEIIPGSSGSMTWTLSDWGFQMSLSKELPVLIHRSLKGYLERLLKKNGPPLSEALFAIHPGGPKILLYIQELLNLSSDQMRFSFEILKNFGNMSSATLPHIWEAILLDPSIPSGTPIISLAFGPGLTIAGALMEKR